MKRIRIEMKEQGELVLLQAESVEDALKWCTSASANRAYIHSIVHSDKDYCFMSTCSRLARVGSMISLEKQMTDSFSVDNFDSDEHRYIVEVELDFVTGKASWIFNEGRLVVESKLPQQPMYLLYSTGYSESGAKILHPIKKV